jgi:hypothetical protein
MKNIRYIHMVALSASLSGFAFAGPASHTSVWTREENQQDRVVQGVDSGELTPHETVKIEKQEVSLRDQVRDDKAANDGHLTQDERQQINKEQNGLSKEIYSQKHDDQTISSTPKSEVGQREENQQDRIAEGIKNGTLSPAEAAELEKRETQIGKEVRTERAENGGHLTEEERDKVNHQLNVESKGIYSEKHDDNNRALTSGTKPSLVGLREENQQDRVAQGMDSGSLTAGEAAKIEGQEAALKNQVHDEREANGGHLTTDEKEQANKEQNGLSKEIYTQKHDDQKANTDPKSTLGKREENQQDRVAQGIRDGSLSPREASQVEKGEAAGNRQARQDRADNGGKLSRQDKNQLGAEQNGLGAGIFKKRHN